MIFKNKNIFFMNIHYWNSMLFFIAFSSLFILSLYFNKRGGKYKGLKLFRSLQKNYFKSITWKHCLFTSICWLINSFYRLSTKLKQKYDVYYVNNLTITVQFTSNSNYNVKRIIISHIWYSKQFCSLPTPYTKFSLNKNMPNYNRFHVNCYLKATYNILLYILPHLFQSLSPFFFASKNLNKE